MKTAAPLLALALGLLMPACSGKDQTSGPGGQGGASASGTASSGVSASSGAGGSGTGDQFGPWAGGAAYYAKWTHGPPSDPSFFPITVWLQSPSNAKAYAAIGINTYI